MAARQTGSAADFWPHEFGSNSTVLAMLHYSLLGCYMIKPHGQLVRVSL
ncbi:uncharacterized protein METZ01_LOCUS58097, partial [marine metagenome]